MNEIFDFFRNELNILPTTKQKEYIKFIHENNASYFKYERQIGETYISMAYLLWLSNMAETAKRNITIGIATRTFTGANNLYDILKLLNNRRELPKEFKKRSSTRFQIGNHSNFILITGDNYRGINFDYIYSNIEDYERRMEILPNIRSTFIVNVY